MSRGDCKVVSWPSTCLLRDRAQAIHAWKPSRTHLPVSLLRIPSMSPSPHCWPCPLCHFTWDLQASSCSCPVMYLLDEARCESRGPRAKSFVAKPELFSPHQTPSLSFGACHSQLPASYCHWGPGKEMRTRNSGTEPPPLRGKC